MEKTVAVHLNFCSSPPTENDALDVSPEAKKRQAQAVEFITKRSAYYIMQNTTVSPLSFWFCWSNWSDRVVDGHIAKNSGLWT